MKVRSNHTAAYVHAALIIVAKSQAREGLVTMITSGSNRLVRTCKPTSSESVKTSNFSQQAATGIALSL